MAATGKKSKKTKWIKADPTNFIVESTTIPTTNNWAESVDEEPNTYSSSQRHRAPVVLPSASRAARGGLAVDDESIPRRPPFIAHISNLPYDVEESAIMELFAGLKINNLRLPKEGGRLKGFGDVDFEDRESLVSAMNMPDLLVGGRRIRIEVSTQDNDRRMGRGGRNDRDREYDPERTMGDWRSGPRAVPARERDGPRDRDRDRDRDRERERDSSADNRPGGWRDAERPEPARAPYGGRDSYGRDRDRDGGRERGYGGRDGFRAADREGGGFGNRDSRGFGGRGFGDRDRDPPREDSKPRERPKLNLLPRTVPRELEAPTKPADGALLEDKVPEKVVSKPVPAEKVFGAAKPVDTAAKEREIEERLRKQEEEARKGADEKERWGRRNDHSGDRRGGPRRDDRERGRDSRSYNRDRRDDDRRDYSKGDKDRRDYSKDARDRREYSKDDRDRRDYSRDDRDRRDRDDSRRDRDDRDRRERDDRDRRDRDDRDRRDRDEKDRPDDRDRRDDRDRDDRRDNRDDDRRDGDVDSRDKADDRRDRDVDRSEKDEEDKRDYSRERRPRDPSPEKKDDEVQRNGRHSRSRDRHDVPDDRPMPKLKEQEKPNFVASNKFSFLEDADDGASD